MSKHTFRDKLRETHGQIIQHEKLRFLMYTNVRAFYIALIGINYKIILDTRIALPCQIIHVRNEGRCALFFAVHCYGKH